LTDRFQKWALSTTIATYILIMVGGLVRASGAGLGCPDWPKCFGRYYPPLTKSQVPGSVDAELFDFQLAWIEYFNRFIGVIVGFLIIGTLYYAIKSHRHSKRVFYPTIAAFILVLFQGWLGGQVVEQELAPWLVTVHLILALVLVSLLLYATVSAFFPETAPFENLPPQRRTLGRLALFVLCITIFQIGLGAHLRGELEVVQEDSPTLERSQWIEHVGWGDPVHRSFSWLVLIGVVALNIYTYQKIEPHRWIHLTVRITAILVVLQILAGIGLAYAGLPPPVQVVHLIIASLLIGALTTIYLLASRLPSQESSSVSKPAQTFHQSGAFSP
jgi:cytochrome c oxidase assembly protein subunit 15